MNSGSTIPLFSATCSDLRRDLSLTVHSQRRYDPNQQGVWYPEELGWRVLECVAKGLAVLEHGTENSTPLPHWKPICHFDIKPENSKSPDISVGTF